jgi:two-component system phosphate regulon sensor histidine kinase PhoR
MIFELSHFNFNLDFKNLFLITFFVIYIVFGFVIFRRNYKDKINLLFFFVLLAVSFWTIGMIFYRGIKDISLSVIFARILYFSATFIPIAFLYFVFNYSKVQVGIFINIILILFFSYIALISILPNFLIKDVIVVPGKEKIIIFDNRLHLLYALYIILYFSVSFYLLFKFLLRSKEFSELTRVQVYYLFLGTIIPTVIGVISNLILPLLGYFELNWLGQIGVISLVILLGYAVLKYQLFNIKIILTEVFVFSLIIIFLLRTLISFSYQDMIYNGIFTLFIILLGILLIRSVYVEVEQREKLEELNRIKSEFLSFASHQVKSPMAIAKGYAELIFEGIENVPEQAKDFAKKIKESVDNLLVLIEEFMDYRRIEEGKIEFNFEKLDIISIIREIVEKMKLLAIEKKLSLDFESKLDLLVMNVDKLRFSQVIQNLIDNAIKYTKEGWIKVKVDKEGNEVLISVSDSGIGMSKELQQKLFGQFVRDPSIKKEIRGTGLGLYIAKHIIEAHKGKIWTESEGIGKGSTFYIKLPMGQ